MTTVFPDKPLGRKAYGHIPHLPGSRLGPGDHKIEGGQAVICLSRVRDHHDTVIVQEKYDGSCVAAARIGDEIIPLNRAGYNASTSPYEQHRLWAGWVAANRERFLEVLEDGERLCGEWLAQAHGTRYAINAILEPFVAFDIIRGSERLTFHEFIDRIVCGTGLPAREPFCTPQVLGYGPTSIEFAISKLCNPWCEDTAEGAVWRVERKGKVDFLAKYVRPEKIDGCYLPEISGKEAVWNWRPEPRP